MLRFDVFWDEEGLRNTRELNECERFVCNYDES